MAARAGEAVDGEDGATVAGEGKDATTTTTTTATTTATTASDAEEESECGFCKYMKGGSCRDAFVRWEACVDEAKARGEDFVETCFETTSALRDCMLLDPEYYGPMTGGEEETEETGEGEGEAAKESA